VNIVLRGTPGVSDYATYRVQPSDLDAVLENALVCVEFTVHHHNFKTHRTFTARPSRVYVLEPGPEAASLNLPVIADPFQTNTQVAGPSATPTAQKRPSIEIPPDAPDGSPPKKNKTTSHSAA